MYKMIAPGMTRPSRISGRRRVVCPLMAAAATLERPTAKMARPHVVLSTLLIFLKIGEDHSACGTDSWTRQSRSYGLKQFQRPLRVAGVVTVGGGDVGVAVQAEQADGQAAQRGHHAGRVSRSDQ